MARDPVELPVDGRSSRQNEPSPIEADWQRWNDYGIGLFSKARPREARKAN